MKLIFLCDPTFSSCKHVRRRQFSSLFPGHTSLSIFALPALNSFYVLILHQEKLNLFQLPKFEFSLLVVHPSSSSSLKFLRLVHSFNRFVQKYFSTHIQSNILIGTGPIIDYSFLFGMSLDYIFCQSPLQVDEFNYYANSEGQSLTQSFSKSNLLLVANERPSSLLVCPHPIDTFVVSTSGLAFRNQFSERMRIEQFSDCDFNLLDLSELSLLISIQSMLSQYGHKLIWKPHPYELYLLEQSDTFVQLFLHLSIDPYKLITLIDSHDSCLSHAGPFISTYIHSSVVYTRALANLQTICIDALTQFTEEAQDNICLKSFLRLSRYTNLISLSQLDIQLSSQCDP